MRLRKMWILGLGVSWLCGSAHAAPFRGGPGGKEDDHGASSLHSKESKLSKHAGRFDGGWQISVGSLPPGLEKKGELSPPGLVAENHDFFPPADQPGGAGLIPEPTGLILFGVGLLLAGASDRRRRSS